MDIIFIIQYNWCKIQAHDNGLKILTQCGRVLESTDLGFAHATQPPKPSEHICLGRDFYK